MDDDGRMVVKEPIMYNGSVMFETSDSASGQTSVPGFLPLDKEKNIYVIDCPGFGDSCKSKEYPN